MGDLTDEQRLRFEVETLYAEYVACLDAGELERWPAFFAEPCVYKIIPRENYERNMPLALMQCESIGMLRDRVEAVRHASVFAPRALRHIVSSLRIEQRDAECIRTSANYVVLETPLGELTRVFVAGQYLDVLVHVAGQLRFKERLCVCDSALIPGSLVLPI